MPVDTKEKSFLVETARHSRAICKKCRQKCIQGNLRLAKLAPNPVGSGTMKTWHHVDCIFELFLRQRKTTKRIEGMHDIEGWELLDTNDKVSILKKIEDCNKALKAKLDNSSKKSESVSAKKKLQISEPPIIEESTCGTPEAMSEPEEDRDLEFHHNSFRYFRIIIYDVSNAKGAEAKTHLLHCFFHNGTDGTGFKSNMYLWFKFLLPSAANRKIPFTPQRLVEIFCKLFDLDSNDPLVKQCLERREHESRKIPKLFDMSKNCRPNPTYSLTLQEVDEFLEKLSSADSEAEQIQHLNNIVSKCSVRDLRFIVRLILQDLRMQFTAKHVCGALHPEAYAMYQSCKDLRAVVDKYWKPPSEEKSPPSKKQRPEGSSRSESKRERRRRRKSAASTQESKGAKKEATSDTTSEQQPGTSSSQLDVSVSSAETELNLSALHVEDDATDVPPNSAGASETLPQAAPSASSDQTEPGTHPQQTKTDDTKSPQAEPGSSSAEPGMQESPDQSKPASKSKRRARKRGKRPEAVSSPSEVDVAPKPSQPEPSTSTTEATPGSSKSKFSRNSRIKYRRSKSPESKHDFIHEGNVVISMPWYFEQACSFYQLTDVEIINLAYMKKFFKGVKVTGIESFMHIENYKRIICILICLGGGIAETPEEATHVFYPHNPVKKIEGHKNLRHVYTDWLKDTVEKQRLQRERDYLVSEQENE